MTKVVKFKCDECQTVGTVDFSDVEYEQEASEGGMGARIEYWGSFEDSCEKCSNSIKIVDNYTEYPADNFEPGETSLTGASLI
ncbi:hypothetical protein ACMXYO_06355 [Neptuniibacter sp. QD37_6]|uniref:hypothetical protein n=1 Tax=Neptuniibacter sp. QD37_6 TaxID=3398210 RepID=UPI0039F4DD3D